MMPAMGPHRRWGGAISAVNSKGRRPGEFPQGRIHFAPRILRKKGSRGACSVGNGMTDPFAVEQYKELYIPMGWTVK